MKIHLKRIAALALVSALFVVPAAAVETEIPAPVLLSWTDDPATTMTFTWQSAGQADAAVQVVTELQYQTAGFTDPLEFPAAIRDISLDGSGVWYSEAAASGLEPSTAYVYRVGNENAWSEQGTFTTSGTDPTSLTFAYMGDVQTADDTAGDYAVWGDFIEMLYQRNPELAFAVVGGGQCQQRHCSGRVQALYSKRRTGVFLGSPVFHHRQP